MRHLAVDIKLKAGGRIIGGYLAVMILDLELYQHGGGHGQGIIGYMASHRLYQRFYFRRPDRLFNAPGS
jgi:hypothetical protein